MKKYILIVAMVVMALSLAGCKSSDYKKAVELQEAADYQGALDLYSGIGSEYKDVDTRAEECRAYVEAIEAFDQAVIALEAKNAELDTLISDSRSLVNGEAKALDESLRPPLETAISEANAARVAVSDMPAELEEIIKQTENMNSADYAAVTAGLNDAYDALDVSIKKYALVNNPDESYIIQRLKNVEHVVDISAATEENDPNGQLGKAGGYTSQVYFSCDQVNQGSVYGDTLIDKGTDAGGSIEVYENEENAIKRNDYLAAFDGSFMASGSHAVIGSCIVRTSDNLTASQQKELEAALIEELTRLE